MKNIVGGAMLLAMTLATPGSELLAQQGRMSDTRARLGVAETPRPGETEQILRMRERLELTDEQVARLDALRAEQVRARSSEQTERAEIQSRVRAGSIDRQEAAEALRGLRNEREERMERDRAALEGVLTEPQRSTLQQLQTQWRAFEAGRRSAMRSQARNSRGGPGLPPSGRFWRGAPSGFERPGMRGPRGGAERPDRGVAPQRGRGVADSAERLGS